jgi:hypothetical protein
MKIFSLQSRKDLIWFSVILGLILNIVVRMISSEYTEADCGELCLRHTEGWPFIYNSFNTGLSASYIFLYNLIFWILIVFGLLNLFKYFKSRH